jgi:hypothetical protein
MVEMAGERRRFGYEHYLTRQLQPVADAILPFMDDRLVDQPPTDFILTLKGKRDPIWRYWSGRVPPSDGPLRRYPGHAGML